MSPPRVRPHLSAALALLLAACTGGSSGSGRLSSGSVYWTYYDTAYTPISDVAIAGGSGELLTQILGNPFNVPQQQFDRAVTDAMYGAHFGPPTRFTTTPVGSFQRRFAVRLVFDSAVPMNINTICVAPPEQPAPRRGPATGSVSLSAAFCQEGRTLTYLEAGGSGYTGPGDPRFVQFIRYVTSSLFSPSNPNNSNFRRGQSDHCHRQMTC
ncbi:MAG TPA: hypothetical protein VFA23_08930 [Dongiaceae bacterium]|nr:hypothetical protein [Dongiaceae bacterium]